MSDGKFVSVYVLTMEQKLKLPIHKTTTVEEIVITICQKLKIGCVARHLFALRNNKHLWTCLSSKLWDSNFSDLEFRVRYRVPDIRKLIKIDLNAFEYYFVQVREDVKIGDVKYDEDKKAEIIGLGVTDMLREMLEKNVSEEVVLNNYTKFMPKEILRQHSFFLKRPVLKKLTELKSCIKHDSAEVKAVYIEETEGIASNYMTEEYEADIDEGGYTRSITLIVNPFHKEIPGVQYRPKNKSELHHICSIEDLCYVTLRSDATVEVSRKNGIPVYLRLATVNLMISFVSLLDGYYRLSVKWTFNLCTDLTTPSLEWLYFLKCHGPVGKEFAYDKLEKKRDCKPGCYILRESESSYNTYFLDVCVKGRSKPVTYTIENRGEGVFWFSADESWYESISALINHYKTPSINGIHLIECIPSSEYDFVDQSGLLLCKVDDYSSSNFGNELSSMGDIVGPPQCINKKFLKLHKETWFEGKRGFTEIHLFSWQKNKRCKIDVAVKFLKQKYRCKYLQDFLDLIGKWSLLHSSAVVQLLGITLGNPVGMVTEYFPYGPLDTYLKNHKNELKDVDLVEAGTYLANALWHLEEEGIVHGYIRCHKILVAAHTDTTFSVRLSDPGIHKKYTDHDIHWIPPECYDCMETALTSLPADVWAFGTTLWQIFFFGIEPNVVDVDVVKQFYRNGQRLPKPSNCPPDIYTLINECLVGDPHQRKKPQAAMRDINRLLYQVFNSRRLHSYATAQPPRYNSCDTLKDISSSALGETQLWDSSNTLFSMASHHFNSELPTAVCTVENGSIFMASENVTFKDLLLPASNNFSTDTSSGSSLGSESILELFRGGKLILQGKIGQGFFGDVYRGLMEGADSSSGLQMVAVKKLRTASPVSFCISDFQNEINIMQMLKHPNIVEVKAVIHEPEINLVMEFVEHGSLICYLNINKEKLDPNRHFMKYALDIAEGMKYLGEKKIVHRDLAARNVLVANEFHVKISDFGLAQFTDHNNYYIVKTCRELPFKWHAPESLGNGKFSSQSDVWSYGVTLYEMFSFGKEPVIECEGCGSDPNQLYNALKKGARLPCPEHCSVHIYSQLMSPCWKYEAKDRPSFSDIVNMLKKLQEI